jgi:hydrogenase maturation factor HypE
MSNENKQTAVEWLIDMHFGGIEHVTPYFKKHIEIAKEMEKEQMIEFALAVLMEAYATVEGNVTTELTIQEYYNLKYGK